MRRFYALSLVLLLLIGGSVALTGGMKGPVGHFFVHTTLNALAAGKPSPTSQPGHSSPLFARRASSGTSRVPGPPTVSADFINRVLAHYRSPAAGTGQVLYDYGVQYGIDPVYALAFFLHESTFGTQGWAKVNLSLGNIRCVPEYPCNHGYSQYSTWEEGFTAWYRLIRTLYVDQLHLSTIAQIIHTYAPAADHNDEAAYVASIEHAVDVWRSGTLEV